MEKDRHARTMALVALIVGVIGLSIGFAAFSNNLTISSSANVKPNDDTFDVNFSSTEGTETDGTVTGTITGAGIKETYAEGEYKPSAEDATIDNSDSPKITGLKANFTEPGQEVVYSFYAHNNGKYKAYLNSISFENAIVSGSDAGTTKKCVPVSATTDTAALQAISAACDTIKIDVTVGSDEAYTGTQSTISGHTLDIDGYEPVKVKITYEGDDSDAGGKRADEEFNVYFGDIVLTYGSAD